MTRLALLLCAVVLVGGIEPALAGPIPAAPVHTSKPRFRIPFRFDPAEMQALGAREIRLFVSRDRGRTWQQTQSVPPDAGKFNFQAPSDGEYWFVVRTLDRNNRLHPDADHMEPGLMVVVDSGAPQLKLELRQPSSGRVQLLWQATDENLDPTQLRLEYIQPGVPDWQTVSVVPKPSGQTEWSIPQGGIVAVRGTVGDLARNVGQDQVQLRVAPADQLAPRPSTPDLRQPIATPGSDATRDLAMTVPAQFPSGAPLASPPAPSLTSPSAPAAPMLAPPGAPAVASRESGFTPSRTLDIPVQNTSSSAMPFNTPFASRMTESGPTIREGNAPFQPVRNPTNRYRMVTSRRFQVGYQLQDVGPSGVSAVELYVTTDDGLTWSKYGDDADTQSPAQVEVRGDGVYGFAIAARSGVGIASDPPQPGEKPAVVVVVDQTPPEIELLPIEQGRGNAVNKLLISWRYRDDFPAEKPVALSYALQPQGPWQTISDWQEHTGSFVWNLGPGVPPKFYLRLEARDAAGNIRAVETQQPVLVDLSRPTARIIDIEAPSSPQR